MIADNLPRHGRPVRSGRLAISSLAIFASADAVGPPAASARAPVSVRDARFDRFFESFRAAVLKGDRQAVAGMTRFPFVDYRPGHYCEPGDTGCVVPADALSCPDRATLLRKYDRVFTPAVVAAIRDRRVRGFAAGGDDGEVAGPIGPEEYLLDLPDRDAQRVFVRDGMGWKMARVPFYS